MSDECLFLDWELDAEETTAGLGAGILLAIITDSLDLDLVLLA